MKNNSRNHGFRVLVTIPIILVCLSISYYYAIRLPQIKTIERTSKLIADYYGCLEIADKAADKQRSEYCQKMNEEYKECIKSNNLSFCSIAYKGTDLMTCLMGSRQLELANELYRSDQESCHNRYPEIPKRKMSYFVNGIGRIVTDKIGE